VQMEKSDPRHKGSPRYRIAHGWKNEYGSFNLETLKFNRGVHFILFLHIFIFSSFSSYIHLFSLFFFFILIFSLYLSFFICSSLNYKIAF
jgi:hypothetical protein